LELVLILPRRIEERLRKEAERTGASIEEVALDVLCRGMSEEVDPAEKTELYARLSERYLKDAEEFLAKGITPRHLRSFGERPHSWLRPLQPVGASQFHPTASYLATLGD